MKALICGISGQDGSYLAKYLVNKGYEVLGTSRDSSTLNSKNLNYLQIEDKVKITSMSICDFGSVMNIVKNFKPDEIYNLAGQTSVGLSFKQPLETMESISKATLILLEVIRLLDLPIKFYSAGSSECFGNTLGLSASEETLFKPCSPYGVAKSSSYWLVRNYREAYGIFACTGILFNHESPLRANKFVTQKIVKSALEIKKGNLDFLKIGNIDIKRDWGWAPDYIEAIWLIMQQREANDFVIATGKSHTLGEFIEQAFNYFELDWQKHIKVDKSLFRPSEIKESYGNPSLAYSKLGWKAQVKFDEIIIQMCKAAEENVL
tara:strand:+ start:497 stop:1456 length:960 start_codon:yes stop_codon:yes gene_type:complete